MDTATQGSSRYRHYAIDLKRYYRLPAVQASLSTVLSLFIVAFFIFVAIRPTFVTIAELRRTIEENSKTLTQLKAKEKAVQQAASVWEKLKDKVVFIDSSYPSTSAEYSLFVKSMEYVAIQNGVELSSETLGSALLFSETISPYQGKARNVISMPMSIRVTGSYEGVTQFYRQLTNMDRIIDVETINFTNDTSNKTKGSLVSLSITGSIGYLADEKALSTVIKSKDKNGK